MIRVQDLYSSLSSQNRLWFKFCFSKCFSFIIKLCSYLHDAHVVSSISSTNKSPEIPSHKPPRSCKFQINLLTQQVTLTCLSNMENLLVLLKWNTPCEHVFEWVEWRCDDGSEWMGTVYGSEVKFVATITSSSSTFPEISPMVSHQGHPFSSCQKNAPLNHRVSLNFTFLLHLVGISAGLHSSERNTNNLPQYFLKFLSNYFQPTLFTFY